MSWSYVSPKGRHASLPGDAEDDLTTIDELCSLVDDLNDQPTGLPARIAIRLPLR